MGNMSLEELRNQAAIFDTTKGKITNPVNGVDKPKTLSETDPTFMPSGQDVRGGHKRTPVIDGPAPTTPSIKVVQSKFESENAMPFDINSLPKRPDEGPDEMEKEIMSELDRAVEKEKKSITERINAITQKQYEEFIEGKVGNQSNDLSDIATNSDEEDRDEEIDSEIDKIFKTSDTDSESVEKENIKRIVLDDRVEVNEKASIITENSNFDSDDDFDSVENNNESYAESKEYFDSDNGFSSTYDDLDKDLSAEAGEDKPNMEKIFDNFKKDIRHVTNPIKNKINLNSFNISKNAVSPATLHLNISDISTADHFLPNSNRVVSCYALSGPEMLRMNPETSNRSKINTIRDIYSIIYKHIASSKPSNFDDWMKITKVADVDHIYFALYKATFGGSNFIHYECPNEKCSNVFIKDIAFDDLIKYSNDEVKEKMENLYRSGDTSIAKNEVELHQISDDLVVGVRNPSIWNAIIEIATLSDDFLTKYEELIDIIAYIDSVYVINKANSSLDPIDMRPDSNSLTKTITRRIKIIYSILRNLPSDNYYELRTIISNSFPNINSVTYRIPECKCPKCGATIPETEITAQQLLFMRHQLGAFGAL